MTIMTNNVPYYISANGVYRCCKYLRNITMYDELKGWSEDVDELNDKSFSYSNIRNMLKKNFEIIKINGIEYFNGQSVWENFFTKNVFLMDRINKFKVTSIEQLHYYANERANGR